MDFVVSFNTLFLGFDDSFRLLERLSLYEFRVPVDLAIQQFKVEFIR